MPIAHLTLLVIAALLAVACWVDLRQRRIPNELCLAGLLVGVLLQSWTAPGLGLLHAAQPGGIGLARALLAAALMLAATLLLWRRGLFGAGDAKLLVALSTFFGPAGSVGLLLFTLAAGAPLAAWGVWRRRAARRIPRLTGQAGPHAALSLPYSLAIAMGTITYIALLRFGFMQGWA